MTAEELRDILKYYPETGQFFWIERRQGRKLNCPTGTPDERGYIRIHIGGRRFTAHRLAILYVNGTMPKGVDHINGDRSDNRFFNLRVANKSENGANARVNSNNTTGFKGVSRYKGRYAAKIMVRRRSIHLGYFVTAEEAHAAYSQAAKKYFGEFARSA